MLDLEKLSRYSEPDRPNELITAEGDAPSYSARAWVNFNGIGVVAIRSAGNVTSITDVGVGLYNVNFETPMQDANYSAQTDTDEAGATVGDSQAVSGAYIFLTNSVGVRIRRNNATNVDAAFVNVVVFR